MDHGRYHMSYVVAAPEFSNGGLFERLAGLSIPSLGITFNGATCGTSAKPSYSCV